MCWCWWWKGFAVGLMGVEDVVGGGARIGGGFIGERFVGEATDRDERFRESDDEVRFMLFWVVED